MHQGGEGGSGARGGPSNPEALQDRLLVYQSDIGALHSQVGAGWAGTGCLWGPGNTVTKNRLPRLN